MSGRSTRALGVALAPWLARSIVVALATGCVACIPHRWQVTPHISGVVADARTSLPIEDARLYYERYPKRVVTSAADGFFDFSPMHKWHFEWLVAPSRGIPMWVLPAQRLIIEADHYHATTLQVQPWENQHNRSIQLTPQ